jgi:CRP-like cAMP-binding protein
MLSDALREMQADAAKWDRCKGFFKVRTIPARTPLLREGDVARFMYFVKQGCLRLWFNKDGKDITFQFFMEGSGVSSIESFLRGQPSLFSLESVEPTTVVAISRTNWDRLHETYPQLREHFLQMLLRRMEDYGRLFLSRIKDSPAERYQALVREQPDLVARIPQHFIASYLGITPVSLSRIRARIHKKR